MRVSFFWIAALVITLLGNSCSSKQPTKKINEPLAPKPMDDVSSALEQLYTMRPETYDAHLLASIANALQALGKDEFLTRVRTFYATKSEIGGGFGLFLLLRIQFDLPEGQSYPSLKMGKPDLDPPAKISDFNRFPILLVDDIPCLLIAGYFSTGPSSSLVDQLNFYQENGLWRDKPFVASTDRSVEDLYQQFKIEWEKVFGSRTIPSTLERSIPAQFTQLTKN